MIITGVLYGDECTGRPVGKSAIIVQDALSENCGVPKTFRNPNFGDRNYSQNDSPETELAAVGREFLSKNPINN